MSALGRGGSAAVLRFREIANSYPRATVRRASGSYEVLRRPDDYLVKFSPAIPDSARTLGDIMRLPPPSRIGLFPTEATAVAAIEAHASERQDTGAV